MRGGRRRGRAGKVVATSAVVIAVVGAAAVAFGFDPTSIGRTPEPEPTAAPKETAEVVQRTLTEIVTHTGSLGYGDPLALGGRLDGTITSLAAVGDVIERGGELYSVDDQPVMLLYGKLPAYRPLARGTEGSDVEQFEKNLAELGYDGFTVDEVYTAETAAAVEEWQHDLGLDETGMVDFGRVVYTSGRIRVEAVGVNLGDPAGPGSPVLSYTGSAKVVTVEVDLDERELVTVGDAVSLTLSDGTETAGTITDTETVTSEPDEPGPEGESGTVLQVTVAVDDVSVVDGLDQASVSVGFSGESAEDVLTVPVEALLGLVEGGYGLEIVNGGSTELLEVETGLFADGYVEVTGKGLADGVKVVVPS